MILRRGCRGVWRRGVCAGWFQDDPNVDDHAIVKVLVSGDEGVPLRILEADPFCSPGSLVEAIEVLDRRDDRIGGVMRIDLDSHGQSSPIVRSFREQEFEGDRFGCESRSRRRIMRSRGGRWNASLLEGWACDPIESILLPLCLRRHGLPGWVLMDMGRLGRRVCS